MKKFFGSELLFLCVGVGRVFFGAVLPMFLLYSSFFRSRNCLGKILLTSGQTLVFWGFFLSSFAFCADVVVLLCVCFLFLFKRKSSGSNRSHPHTHLCFFLFLFVSRRNWFVLPFWPCVLSFWRFVGAPFWAPGVFWILSGLL